jgi:transposase-like protein
VLKTLDAVACAFTLVYAAARERAAASGSPLIRAFAFRDQQALLAALDGRCLALLRARWERLPTQKRPDYSAAERAEILQILRLRNWNVKKTARFFMLHPNTIRAWRREMNGGKKSGILKPPVNKISEAGRWLVHEIRTLCPEKDFGTRTIALQLRVLSVRLRN